MILLLPSILLLLFYCILIVYYRQVWKQIPEYKKPVDASTKNKDHCNYPGKE